MYRNGSYLPVNSIQYMHGSKQKICNVHILPLVLRFTYFTKNIVSVTHCAGTSWHNLAWRGLLCNKKTTWRRPGGSGLNRYRYRFSVGLMLHSVIVRCVLLYNNVIKVFALSGPCS